MFATFECIVNLRPRTATSHWYESQELCSFMYSLEVPRGSVYKDSGRNVKDKDLSTKQLCRKIVTHLRRHQPVYIACMDGYTTAGFLALACKGWYEGIYDTKSLIDPVRLEGDFSTARDKLQRAQMEEIFKYAKEIENCPFIKKC